MAAKALGLSGNYTQALEYMLRADAAGHNLDVKLALSQLYYYAERVDEMKLTLSYIHSYCSSGFNKDCIRFRKDIDQVLNDSNSWLWYNRLSNQPGD